MTWSHCRYVCSEILIASVWQETQFFKKFGTPPRIHGEIYGRLERQLFLAWRVYGNGFCHGRFQGEPIPFRVHGVAVLRLVRPLFCVETTLPNS